jgi:hypothetical protein
MGQSADGPRVGAGRLAGAAAAGRDALPTSRRPIRSQTITPAIPHERQKTVAAMHHFLTPDRIESCYLARP